MRLFAAVLLVALACFGAAPAMAQDTEGGGVEFEFLIPDEALLIYDMHNAAVFTPDQMPPNAVYRQHSRAEAQVAVAAMEQEEGPVVAEIEVQGEPRVAVYELDLRGEPVYISVEPVDAR